MQLYRIMFLVLRGWSKKQGQDEEKRSLDQRRHTQASTQIVYSSDDPKAFKI